MSLANHRTQEAEPVQPYFAPFSFVVPGLNNSENHTSPANRRFSRQLARMVVWNEIASNRAAIALSRGIKYEGTEIVEPIRGHGITFHDPNILYHRRWQLKPSLSNKEHELVQKFLLAATDTRQFYDRDKHKHKRR